MLFRSHLDWIAPLGDEPIQSYARRLWEQVDLGIFENLSNLNIVLVGHSFGGIMIQEMAQHIEVQKLVLISSIKSRAEHPLHFRILAPIGLHRFFTQKIALGSFPFWAKHADYASPEAQSLFKRMIGKQTDLCLKWSLKTLSNWQTPPPTQAQTVHIHGTADRNFPVRLIRPPFYEVKNGGHFMVFNRAGEVGQWLRAVLV